MKYQDLIDIATMRATQINLQVDEVELQIGMYFGLQRLADSYDLDSLTVMNDAMILTAASVERYALPEDFGRLLHPRGTKISGILIWDGTSALDLVYTFPQDLQRIDRTLTGRPGKFTIVGRDMLLNPLPDANGTTNYTIRGSYIKRVERFNLDDDVQLPEPTVLVADTLFQIAADRGMPQATALFAEKQAAMNALVTGQAKIRQQFYTHRLSSSARTG